jgi:hypothetical protein
MWMARPSRSNGCTGLNSVVSENFRIAMTPITPKDLDKIRVHDRKGRLAACLAMGVTLYFEDPHARSVREKTAECIEQYLSLTRSHLRWYALGEDRPKDLSSNEPPDFKKVVAELEEYDIFDTDLSGADDFGGYLGTLSTN